MNKYFGPILSKCQFGFREGCSAQQYLLIMIEEWRASLDQNGTCAALLTDLSKAFDCLLHDLLIAKLHAYGCDLPSLKLLNCYLRNRPQRVKINNFYRYDSYADDTTPYEIKIDSNLNFKEHIESLCKKASQKINALSRLASSTNFEQRRHIINSFVICHFSYCQVRWLFHSRKLNARINRLHERALRLVYKDFDSSFEELLRTASSTTLHQRNLQKLMTEIIKTKTGIVPELMKGVFEFADVPYNLRNQSKCSRSIQCTERYGIETASSIGPKLQDQVPTEIKNSKSLEEFKARIKS